MKKNIEIPIFILAGGRGTRLLSVVNDVPKPLAPVLGKPFLQYLLENYSDQGFSNFIFLLHYKADLIIEFLKKMKSSILFQSDIQYSIEPSLLGTGGAVAYALNSLKYIGDFLIVNADTWVDAKSMQSIYDASSPAMGVISTSDASRYGKVSMSGDMVTEFEEKRENAGSGLINAGLYKLHSSIFEGRVGEFSMEKDIFPELIKNKNLQAVPLDTEFIDIGIPEDYQRFQNWISSDKENRL